MTDDSIIGPAGRFDPGQQGAEAILKVLPPLVARGGTAEHAGASGVRPVFRRQQEYGQSPGLQAADFAAYIQDIGIRQVRVQQDNIRLSGNRSGHTRPAVGCGRYPAARNAQAGLQPLLEVPGLPDN